ncbi:MAG TPA: M15 family metallopeptidase [Candidatus Dormibacteraeota bacterium]|nr:M15 family metallopeptidase [Candidatus Dormibacteraeota bacterium]
MSAEYGKLPPVLENPEKPCPTEILRQQIALPVTYYGFDRKSHSGLIEVNLTVVDDVKAFFDLALELNFLIEKVVPASNSDYQWDDNKLMAANVSSGFNYRLIAGTDKVSLHGHGLAFDINPRQNPYIRHESGEIIVAPTGAVWEPDKSGTLSDNHPLVQFMLECGWEWGGNWSQDSDRTDYQHFQKPN